MHFSPIEGYLLPRVYYRSVSQYHNRSPLSQTMKALLFCSYLKNKIFT